MQTITRFFPKKSQDDSHELLYLHIDSPPAPNPGPQMAESAPAANSPAARTGSGSGYQFYSDELKVSATEYALANGIAAGLRKFPEIKRSTLRGWVAKAQAALQDAQEQNPEGHCAIPVDYDVVLSDGRASNGRKVPQSVYDRVYDRVYEMRDETLAVSRDDMRRELLAAATELHPSMLPEHGGWLRCSAGMMANMESEMSLSRRVATNAKRGQADKETSRKLYIARIAYVCHVHSIPKDLVFHMDETGVHLLPVPTRTLATKGSKVVSIAHGDDKRQVTCVIGGDLAGSLLPLQIIYGAGAQNRLPKVEGVFTTWSPSHWSTLDTLKQWLDDVLVPVARSKKEALGLDAAHPVLLTWDVYPAHRSSELRDYMHRVYPWIKLVYVPANCTDFLQVADVALNMPFKRRLRAECQEWLVSEMKAGRAPDTGLRGMRIRIAQWAKAAADGVAATSAAANGIRQVGLTRIKRMDEVNVALSLHEAKHLWASASRNDIVAIEGAAAGAAVCIPPPPACVDISDDEGEDVSSRPRALRKRCSYCNQGGHTKLACDKYKLKLREVWGKQATR